MKCPPFWFYCIALLSNLISILGECPRGKDCRSKILTKRETRRTSSLERKFAALFINKYGNPRNIDGPIRLMDGTQVYIADSAIKTEKGITFTRGIHSDQAIITSINLKPPQSFDKTKADTKTWEVDHSALDFNSYTITMIEEMFASGAVEIDDNARAQVLSIGLGAGYINSYLHKVYTRMNITVVEIDQNMLNIATKWFGLKLDNRQRVVVEDGKEFVRKAVRLGAKYDVIHIDACSMKESPNCPSSIFYTDEMVRNLATLINRKGVVIINVFSLQGDNTVAAKKVSKAFEKAFKKCLSETAAFSTENIVMTCSQFQRPPGLKEQYQKLKNYPTSVHN